MSYIYNHLQNKVDKKWSSVSTPLRIRAQVICNVWLRPKGETQKQSAVTALV